MIEPMLVNQLVAQSSGRTANTNYFPQETQIVPCGGECVGDIFQFPLGPFLGRWVGPRRCVGELFNGGQTIHVPESRRVAASEYARLFQEQTGTPATVVVR